MTDRQHALRETGIQAAIRVAGSQDKLAEMMGCSQQVVSEWLARGYAPADRVIEMESLTGIPRERLLKPSLVELLSKPSMTPVLGAGAGKAQTR